VDELRIGTTYNSVTGSGELLCGQAGTVYLLGDLNKDCYVNILDFSVFAADWLKCTDPADTDNCSL
jgi:hypothetical protein